MDAEWARHFLHDFKHQEIRSEFSADKKNLCEVYVQAGMTSPG